jgi:hypothetical protein
VSPRLVIAGVVIVVGSTLWAVLPGNPGSLSDESTAVRWRVPRGEALAAWVLVRNTGPDRIILRGVLTDPLADGVQRIGSAARRGYFPAVDDTWPSPKEAFRPLNGFVMLPHTKATIALGLAVTRQGRFTISGVRVRYRQEGDLHEEPVGARAVIVVR